MPHPTEADFEAEALIGPSMRIAYELMHGVGLILSFSAAAAGEAEILKQQNLLDTRPTLLNNSEVMEALRRGEVGDAQFENTLNRAGYTDVATGIIKKLAESLLQPGELLALWRREEIDDVEVDAGLHKLGFTPDNIVQLKELAFEVAGPQDVIRFTVREVFNPELRAALELDTDFPIEAEAAFKATGLKPDLARDFWAAHWELPSIRLAFEMLHRKEITEDDLDLILRAQDVLPRFREPIKAVAFRPFTRVDLRRMHALGILNEDEVKRGYEDIGYSPEKSQQMLDFTIAFNADDDPEESAKTRDLTRSQVTSLFSKGIFTREDSKSALLDLGYSDDNTETILLLEEFKLLERERTAEVRIITGKFENGAEGYNDTVAALDALGMTAQQRDLTMIELEAERISRIRLPTRAEMDRFLREKLVNVEDYVDELERIGIPDPWRERFAELVTGGTDGD